MTAGEHLEQLWYTAAARPAVSAFRTAHLGIDTVDGPVLAGVDAEGRRHLLVPITARRPLTEDLGGRAVVLRRRTLEDENSRRTYAALGLVDPRLSDLFTALCVEVTERVSAAPTKAVVALQRVLADWRALLAGDRQVLGPAALAGLFGELTLLSSLVDRDPGAAVAWTGPTGSAQDFHHGPNAVEVKTTVAPEGRVVRIHGTDQLDVPATGRLLLHWIRLRTNGGTSVPELVTQVLDRCADPAVVLGLLRRVGYLESDREVYGRRRFEVVETRTHEIGPGFPRIIRSGLSGDAVLAGIGSLEYTVDLDAAPAVACATVTDPVGLLLDVE